MTAREAWVTELTGLLHLLGWPPGMRVIARKECPHPGAQLWLTDVDGHRITCFPTSTKRGQLADLRLRLAQRWPWPRPSPQPSAGSQASHPADAWAAAPTTPKDKNQGPWNPRTPGSTAPACAQAENTAPPTAQVANLRSRNIEAKVLSAPRRLSSRIAGWLAGSRRSLARPECGLATSACVNDHPWIPRLPDSEIMRAGRVASAPIVGCAILPYPRC